MNEEEKREARGIFLLPLGTPLLQFAFFFPFQASTDRAHNSRKK
jgi:hypothetical protein